MVGSLLSSRKPALDLRIYSRRGTFHGLTALIEESPVVGQREGRDRREDSRDAPPMLLLGSVLGAKGEAKAWPPQTRKTGISTELREGLLGPSKLWPVPGL